MNSYSQRPEQNPLFGKIICGECNRIFERKNWTSTKGNRKVWQCRGRYLGKGKQDCTNRHVDEAVLEQFLVMAWNQMIGNKDEAKRRWERTTEFGNPLEQYRAMQFSELMEPIDSVDTDFILKVLEYIKVYENGAIEVKFLDGAIDKFGV